MEMEDHHQQQQYGGMTDLRQLVSNNGGRSTTHFGSSIAAQPTAELFPGQPNLGGAQHHHQHYEMMMFGRQVADLMPRCLHEFGDVNNNASSIGIGTATTPTPTTTTSASTPPGCLGGDASTGRWPRQETLTLLEIRSRLDPKFKEANQKGPLWDEVSRIMSEEHGYQRSGKKCREKFENLYKYYKKTKEGKAGRQDGKHYRFFRQLEALYGENNSNNTNAATASAQETNFGGSTTALHYQTSSHAFNSQINQEMLLLGSQNSLSLTNSTEFETSSSDDDDHNSTGGVKEKNDESMDKRRKRAAGTKSWKVKIKDFIDLQMRKLVQKQEEWLDKLMKTLEQKEKERVLREEEWRRQEAARLEREHKFWAKERSWIEARDAALMEALHKLTGTTTTDQVKSHHHHDGIIMQNEEHNNEDGENWQECEISRLVQLRAEIMETRFRQGGGCGGGCSEEGLWEEIATKMACFGYERSSTKLKEKWETISKGINNKKKRKENNPNSSVVRSSSSCFYIENKNNNNDHYSSSSSLYNNNNHHHGYCDINNDQRRQQQSSPSNSNANASVHQAENCFPFLMGCEGGTLWDNYSLKVNKPNQNHQ